jgi:acyl-CoA synthetase (AMP-forming)/AMP-acid ligase II
MVCGFAERHGVQIVNYFGSNEGAALSGSDIDIPDPALRAQYFPRAGVPGFDWRVSTARKIQTRLVDLDSGADITRTGQPGELRFKGPTVFSGYFNAPDMSTRAFDEQGFYRTGDLFVIAGDRRQYYRYVGRSKDLVMRGGMNISSEEIEGLLAACPGVQEVAVVGVPDQILGERLCACVVSAPNSAWQPTSCPNTCFRLTHCPATRWGKFSSASCVNRPVRWPRRPHEASAAADSRHAQHRSDLGCGAGRPGANTGCACCRCTDARLDPGHGR